MIKTTGYFDGLYTEQELQSENVKDRDSKIAFLQKAIDVVSECGIYIYVFVEGERASLCLGNAPVSCELISLSHNFRRALGERQHQGETVKNRCRSRAR